MGMAWMGTFQKQLNFRFCFNAQNFYRSSLQLVFGSRGSATKFTSKVILAIHMSQTAILGKSQAAYFLPRFQTWNSYQIGLNNSSTCVRHSTLNYPKKEQDTIDLIRKYTKKSRQHLTPELQLNLITPECFLWKAPYDKTPFPEPYWAFYWPGGQAVARYILDNQSIVNGSKVLDFGCGSGACGIAAAKSGAGQVFLNDIDPVACLAAIMNAKLNSVCVNIVSENLLSTQILELKWDLILVGDMFYDETFASVLFKWLKRTSYSGSTVLIGDPGRLALSSSIKNNLVKLHEYALPEISCAENSGFSSAAVWKLNL